MGLLVLWTAVAQAQTAPADQDKAAMERAQREAEGPRRRILEAARLKTVARAPEAAQPALAAPASPPSPRAAPRSDEAEGSMAVLSPAGPPLSLQSAAMALPGIGAVAPVALMASAPSMINVPDPTLQSRLLPPRLLSRVDPELPAYLLRRGAQRTELVVELVVNTDGSVRDVSVRKSPGAALEEPVIDAVRQWRFEPQPVARPHVVRLVVSPG